jgi:hypothetical protein
LSWLIRERAAFRRQADWPTPKTDAEKATKATLDHYRAREPRYTWESLAESTLGSDVGLESTARSIAHRQFHCPEEATRNRPAGAWARESYSDVILQLAVVGHGH